MRIQEQSITHISPYDGPEKFSELAQPHQNHLQCSNSCSRAQVSHKLAENSGASTLRDGGGRKDLLFNNIEPDSYDCKAICALRPTLLFVP